jgi:hypothetical protein
MNSSILINANTRKASDIENRKRELSQNPIKMNQYEQRIQFFEQSTETKQKIMQR